MAEGVFESAQPESALVLPCIPYSDNIQLVSRVPAGVQNNMLLQRILRRFDLSIQDNQKLSIADNEMYQRQWTIHCPEVEAMLDSKHFQVLIDVIAQLLMMVPRIPDEDPVEQARRLLRRHSVTTHGIRRVAETLNDALQASVTATFIAHDVTRLKRATENSTSFFSSFSSPTRDVLNGLQEGAHSALQQEESKIAHALPDLGERTRGKA